MKKMLFFFAIGMMMFAQSAHAKQIHIISREEWGADESYTFQGEDKKQESTPADQTKEEEKSETKEADPEISKIVTENKSGKKYVWPLQYAKDIKFIVIHYTAVTNNLDKPITDIRNIYHAHAVGNGWGDVGYHYLIDRNGKIYEGRKGGDSVIGGHAKPVNKVSIGVALMGNYEDEELPAPMVESTVELLDFLTKKYKIDPLGRTEYKEKTYQNIHGHSDNTAKSDPGKFFRQKFQYIRSLLAYKQAPKNPADPARYDFSPITAENFIVTPPDSEKEFTLRVKNKGTVRWNKDTYLENTTESALPRVFAKLAELRLGLSVKPGEIGTFKGTIPKRLISGMLMPETKLVINGSIRTDKSFPVPIMVEGLKLTYEIVGRQDPPSKLKAGQRARGWIMLKNTGNVTWKRNGKASVTLGVSHPKDKMSPLFEGKSRIAKLVEKQVKPGEVGKFSFSIKAPKQGGTYTEYFQPVLEGVSWMNDLGMHLTVTVKSKERPLRVALSKFKGTKAEIGSAAGMNLFEGKTLVRELPKEKTVTVSMLKSGKYRVKIKNEKLTLASPPRFTATGGGPLKLINFENRPEWNKNLNDNLFMGTLEVQKIDDKFTVINELPLEEYLKGLAEVSNGDPVEKIKTIIILARSYAKYYRDIGKKFPGKPYDLDDDPDHTQKYVGYGLALRSPNIVSAIFETAGKVVTYQGKYVVTPYFSQSDGRTRSAKEAWNRDDLPYLQSVPDDFCPSKELKGHGVGVSGCGATELAKQGKTAFEIIKYYYKGVEITD